MAASGNAIGDNLEMAHFVGIAQITNHISNANTKKNRNKEARKVARLTTQKNEHFVFKYTKPLIICGSRYGCTRPALARHEMNSIKICESNFVVSAHIVRLAIRALR